MNYGAISSVRRKKNYFAAIFFLVLKKKKKNEISYQSFSLKHETVNINSSKFDISLYYYDYFKSLALVLIALSVNL